MQWRPTPITRPDATTRAHADGDHAEHWSDFQYVKLAILLAVVTAVEVLLSATSRTTSAASSCRPC